VASYDILTLVAKKG